MLNWLSKVIKLPIYTVYNFFCQYFSENLLFKLKITIVRALYFQLHYFKYFSFHFLAFVFFFKKINKSDSFTFSYKGIEKKLLGKFVVPVDSFFGCLSSLSDWVFPSVPRHCHLQPPTEFHKGWKLGIKMKFHPLPPPLTSFAHQQTILWLNYYRLNYNLHRDIALIK